MNILIVDELCYPQLGGQQIRFKELAEEWVKQDHSVEIVAIDHIGNLPEHEIINGVKYSRIVHNAFYYKSGKFGRDIKSILQFTFKLRHHFVQKWDLIIFNQFPVLPSIFYKLFYRKRSITLLDFVEHRSSTLWKSINKLILNSTDGVVCISNHIRGCVSNYRTDKLFVIPSLMDMSKANSHDKQNYVFLGRLEKHKHPELAIQTVLNYNLKYDTSKIIEIMGTGFLYDQLIQEFGKSPNVIFHGSVNDETKNKILESARVLILPSEREGLPKVVIEAMAYGIPTLTTRYESNGTHYFILEEKVGATANPTIRELVEGLQFIESNYNELVNNCEQKKNKFDLKANSVKYLDILNTL